MVGSMVMTRVILLRASSHAVRYPLNLHRQNQAMKMNMDYRQGGVPSLSLSAGMDSAPPQIGVAHPFVAFFC